MTQFNAVMFDGENYAKVCILEPDKLHLVEKHIGPGNDERWIEHSEIGERLYIGGWAARFADEPLVFLSERTLRHLVAPIIDGYCRIEHL